MPVTNALTFKWLSGDELDVLDEHVRSYGWTPLNKQAATALVAYGDGGAIIGFVCFNLVPHIEPLWISREFRGSELAEAMVRQMVQFCMDVNCPAAYVVADNPASARLAELHGMQRVDVPVYRRIV